MRVTHIDLTCLDGETYRFHVRVGELRELQDKCDAGPAVVYQRLVSGLWRLEDLRETIRLGLIGGGMAPTDAAKLVKNYVDARPLAESVPVATAILGALLVGVEEVMKDKPEKPAGGSKKKTSRAENGISPQSIEPPQATT